MKCFPLPPFIRKSSYNVTKPSKDPPTPRRSSPKRTPVITTAVPPPTVTKTQAPPPPPVVNTPVTSSAVKEDPVSQTSKQSRSLTPVPTITTDEATYNGNGTSTSTEHNGRLSDQSSVSGIQRSLSQSNSLHNADDNSDSKKSSLLNPKTSEVKRPSENRDVIGKFLNQDTETEIIEGPRMGVIAQTLPPNTNDQNLTTATYEKDESTKKLIRKAIMANDFLKNLMVDERLDAVVEAMSPKDLEKDSYIIKEGETGSHLYVSSEGTFEVHKDSKVVATFGAGVAFGELAILYRAKRFASIKVKTDAKVWVLERKVFRQIMIRTGRKEQEENVRFLSSVKLLEDIHPIEINKIADLVKREFYSTGTLIIRQGEPGDKFYIIRGGNVTVTKRKIENGPEEYIGELKRGDYFGEQALLFTDKRLASVTANDPGVECLTLNRLAFIEILGNLDEIKTRRHSGVKEAEPTTTQHVKTVINPEFENIYLTDFKNVGTLGVGGFGRVELVQLRKDNSKSYALKYLKKIDMVQQQQQDHAYNEKEIMVNCNSPFICQLYQTYRDNKYLYFLMEACLGGDVWTVLQKHKFFEEKIARFMTACVVEAFEYMHDRGMIYRDLKPENLMLDSKGYVKLVDFGFAKKVAVGTKTWTFAGTPEYVAPEIILNKGHDRAVDYWALGIFINELLVGKPPFRGSDNMKTYHLILRGIDAITFSPKVSKKAQILIKKLCRPVATDRLGYQKNGLKDIKSNQWFDQFSWEKLRNKKMTAPLILHVANSTDLSHFAKYPKDKDVPPDETSGWDNNF